MLIFAIELQRRSQAAGWGIRSVAAHPGWATTDLMANGPNSNGNGKFLALLAGLFSSFFSHAPAAGALPILFAATDPEAKGGGTTALTVFTNSRVNRAQLSLLASLGSKDGQRSLGGLGAIDRRPFSTGCAVESPPIITAS